MEMSATPAESEKISEESCEEEENLSGCEESSENDPDVDCDGENPSEASPEPPKRELSGSAVQKKSTARKNASKQESQGGLDLTAQMATMCQALASLSNTLEVVVGVVGAGTQSGFTGLARNPDGTAPMVNASVPRMLRVNAADRELLSLEDFKIKTRVQKLKKALLEYRNAKKRGELIDFDMIFEDEVMRTFNDWYKDDNHDWWERYNLCRRPGAGATPEKPSVWSGLEPEELEWFIMSNWSRYYRDPSQEKTLNEEFAAVKMQWSKPSYEEVNDFIKALRGLVFSTESYRYPLGTKEAMQSVDRLLIERVVEKGIIETATMTPQYNLGHTLKREIDSNEWDMVTWDRLIERIHTLVRSQLDSIVNVTTSGWSVSPSPIENAANTSTAKPAGIAKRDLSAIRAEEDRKVKKPKPDVSRSSHPPCTGCGRPHGGGADTCTHRDRPGFNHSGLPWAESESGKLMKSLGFDVLRWDLNNLSTLSKKKDHGKDGNKTKQGMSTTLPLSAIPRRMTNTITLVVVDRQQPWQEPRQAVQALIDTGAEIGSCIDSRLASSLRKKKLVGSDCECESCRQNVCSVIKSLPCIRTCGKIELNILFPKNQVFAISFIVLPSLEREMIIGIDDIRRYDITRLCREVFVEDNGALRRESIPERVTSEPAWGLHKRTEDVPLYTHENEDDMLGAKGARAGPSTLVCGVSGPKGLTSCTRSLTYCQRGNEFVGSLVHMTELLNLSDGIPDGDVFWREDIVSAITKPDGDRASTNRSKTTRIPRAANMNSDNLELPVIKGNESVHVAARRIVEKHWRVFSRTVNPEPADVAPMELRLVDESKWRVPANSLAPRVQSLTKENALKESIGKLLAQRIISPSQATHYSQVLLVAKPGSDNAWRLCIDYRALNESLEGMGWPIPHIQQLVERIGRKKPKWFAVLDLTSGYHQVLLSRNSREYAAFITPFGTYVPNRISMGLKSAPSYFQQQMQISVLADLMYVTCELYIDDIIAYGETEEEFIEHLERILKRLEDKRITINPDKAKIAVSEVEAVGHVLDQYGIRMSIEKINKVMNFPPPKLGKHLKQFLGMANYFRRHIKGYAMIARPLELLVRDYKRVKHQVVRWNAEAIAALNELQAQIQACPKLYFARHDMPIYLDTDASDYAIGAYLYQVVDTEQQPIAFMSKSLSGAQLNWSTIEKECFAIYSALREWEYLLRDVPFVINTDHKNLRYLNTNTPKVVRWKLAIQEFNFSVNYLPGEQNVVADTLSRVIREDSLPNNDSGIISPEVVRLPIEEEEDESEDEQTDSHVIAAMQLPSSSGPMRPVVHHEEQSEQYSREIAEKISSVHNSYRGHFGVDLTLEILRREQSAWRNMRKHVREFIHSCSSCQKMRDIKPVIVSLPYTTATYSPFSRVNMDTIGPLPVDEDKNEHILVLIDCFSRFVELYAIPSLDARTCARCLINFTGRYGAPEYLLSDRGSQFVNGTIQEMLRLIGTTQILSLAYSKQENAIVERANKEVMRHLRGIIFDTRVKKEWSVVLPLVQRIMNAHPHQSIGIAPAQIIFGNAVQLDRGILFHGDHVDVTNPNTLTPSIKQYLDRLLSAQSKIVQCAQEHQLATDQARAALIQKRGRGNIPTEFPINSYVLLKYHSGLNDSRGPTKLHTRWQGPYRVVGSRGDQYTLQNLVTSRESMHHVKELAPFRWNADLVDPKEVAWRDNDLFQIEQVVSHTGDMNRVSTLQFRVRWLGYSPEEDTIEPWKNLRNNGKLHEYLRKIGKYSKIPQEFRSTK